MEEKNEKHNRRRSPGHLVFTLKKILVAIICRALKTETFYNIVSRCLEKQGKKVMSEVDIKEKLEKLEQDNQELKEKLERDNQDIKQDSQELKRDNQELKEKLERETRELKEMIKELLKELLMARNV